MRPRACAPKAIAWLTLPDVFEQKLELPALAEGAPELMWSANRLLARAADLAARAPARRAWRSSCNGRSTSSASTASTCRRTSSITVRTAEPTQDMAHLRRLMAERLALTTLAAPASWLRLRSLETTPWAGASTSFLPEDNRKGDKLHELVERLSARLGRAAGAGAGGAGRPPAGAQAGVAAGAAAGAAPGADGRRRATGHCARPARPDAHATRPGCCANRCGWNATASTRCYHGPLRRLVGPQRVEAGWWGGAKTAASRRCATTTSPKARRPAWCGSTASGRRPASPPRQAALVPARPLCLNSATSRLQRAPAAASCMRCRAAAAQRAGAGLPGYAELHCLTNFSFQRGASHPEELVRARLPAGLRGARHHRRMLGGRRGARARRAARVPQARRLRARASRRAAAAAQSGFPPAVRQRVRASSASGWWRSRTTSKAGATCASSSPPRASPSAQGQVPRELGRQRRAPRCATARSCSCRSARRARCSMSAALARRRGAGRSACSARISGSRSSCCNELDDDLWLATLQRGRRAQPACRWWRPATCRCTCARASRCRTCSPPCAKASRWPSAASRCSPTPSGTCARALRLAELYPPELLANTLAVAGALQLHPRASCELRVPARDRAGRRDAGADAGAQDLGGRARRVTRTACRRRCAQQIEHELALIAELEVRDVLPHGRRHRALRRAAQDILCQGRGSAANSAVCYCLGITEVDPDTRPPAVRALHQPRAQRAARHRRRLRAPAARGGHPVHLREVRPRPRRHRRGGDLLPLAQRAARRRQGAGHRRAAGRRVRQGPLLVRRRPSLDRAPDEAHAALGVREDAAQAARSGSSSRSQLQGLSAPPVPARRRLRAHADASSRAWCRSRTRR